MADDDPNIDLPEVEEKTGFPWIAVLLAVVVAILVIGWWFHREPQHQGKEIAMKALEQQLTEDRATLDAERAKVVDMTQRLEAMKQAMALHQVKDPKQAVADYNQLAADQRAQRDKVKELADKYNQKIATIRTLEQ